METEIDRMARGTFQTNEKRRNRKRETFRKMVRGHKKEMEKNNKIFLGENK